MKVSIDIIERMRAEQHMRRMATHDCLTGLVNRAVLRDRIEQALKCDQRSAHRAAVLFIDLDQFKGINDSLGHEVGDQLLVQVARRLVGCVRDEDTVARQGGDEFIVLLPHIDTVEGAQTLADKLVHRLSQAFLIGGRELYVGASIGIAVFPDHGSDVDALLKNSDAAMYHVKSAGRNHHATYSPQMHSSAIERYALGVELRRALEHEEFELHFQPVIGMSGGRIEGLEALARWQHPVHGLLPPQQFIPLAEESGLIVSLGEWIIRAACRQIRCWRDAGVAVPPVAINLKTLPIDTLKVDRAFVKDIGTEADDGTIVTAIVAMAKSMKLTVIAEGVETTVQLDFLRALGCEQFQGYLVSRPLPAQDIEAFLRMPGPLETVVKPLGLG